MGFSLASTISLIVTAIGVGFSAYAASEQAASQRRTARAEQSLREQEAESIRQAAAYDERQFRRRAALLLGRQHAMFAEAGLDPTSGSPMLLEIDSVRQAEMEALNIRGQGERGAGVQDFEARMARSRAAFFRRQQFIAPALTAFEGTGSILGRWADRRRPPTRSPIDYGPFPR
jgi:hypothetical protein